MATCFIIMSYGGDDLERKRHFDGVFRSILKPAAEAAGYEAKRSDIAGEPGNITQDIIRDLADSEMVIADLTEGNPNVFLELGIRHVLRKSGTVHVIDQDGEIPFDIRSYRAVKYSTALADVPQVVDEIVKQIKKREESRDRSDNPVHDTLPGLPVDYLSATDSSTRETLERLQENVRGLENERDQLAARLAEIDPSRTLDSASEVDVDRTLDEADEAFEESTHALLKLQKALDTSGRDGFVAALREVLRSHYLDDNDFVQIQQMCHKLGLPEHRRATMEILVNRHPKEDFRILLARCCMESPNPSVQDRGRLMLEKLIGVEHGSNGPVVNAKPPLANAMAAIGALFDAYAMREEWTWVRVLSESAEAVLGPKAMLLRNRAVAESRMGNNDTAEPLFKRAIELDPANDTTHAFYSTFLDEVGRYEESYSEHETALRLDPDDPIRWMNVAITVLNRGYVRDIEGGAVRGGLSRTDRRKYAIPLIFQALDVSDRNPEVVQQAVTVLVRANAVQDAEAIADGKPPKSATDDSLVKLLIKGLGGGQPRSLTREHKSATPKTTRHAE